MSALSAAATASLISASRLSVNGLATGLDTDKIIQGLLTISGGAALSDLGFLGTETGQGTDVAGNYLVNGLVEAAQGAGQFLLGNASNANTADLQERILLAGKPPRTPCGNASKRSAKAPPAWTPTRNWFVCCRRRHFLCGQ